MVDTLYKTVLFIQIDNFIDFLRLINLVKNLNAPYLKFLLITRKRFVLTTPFEIGDLFDKIFFLEKKELITSADLKTILGNISQMINSLKECTPDLTINLSVGKTAAILSSLLKHDNIHLGCRYDNSFRLEILGDISSYIMANIENKFNPFNLEDFYRLLIDAPPVVVKYAPIKSLLIHPYHPDVRSMWHHSKWVDIVISLSEHCPSTTIYLVDDFKLLRNYIFRPNVVIIDSDEISAHLKIVELVIGHYEQTILLADLYQKRSLFIPLGPNKFVKNGSGLPGNYIVTPKTDCFPCYDEESNKNCHAFIKSGVVVQMVSQLIQDGEISYDHIQNYIGPFLNSINIYQTYYGHNILLLRNIINKSMDELNIWHTFYTVAFSYILFKAEMIFPFLDIDTEESQKLELYRHGLQHLYELNEFGKKYTYYLLDELKNKKIGTDRIKEYSVKLDEIEELQGVLRDSYPKLTPIIDLYKLKNQYLSFENLAYLSYDSFLIYHEASLICQVIYELIEKTLCYKRDLKL